jgi:hypothetical protein
MFLTCLVCFKVVKPLPPWDDSSVVPIICSGCRHCGTRALREFGIGAAREGAPIRTRLEVIENEKVTESGDFCK